MSKAILDFLRKNPYLFMGLAALFWFGLYQQLLPLSETLVASLPVERESHLGGALQFFFYDTPKILLLLTGIVFVMGIIHTYISPEKTRAMLAGKKLGMGNSMAATLGILVVCSCFSIDGEVIHSGCVPSKSAVESWLN